MDHKYENVLKWLTEDLNLHNSTICDIGVGHGQSSLYFASKGSAKVFGIEPSEGKGHDKDVYKIFINNIKRHDLDNIVIPLKIDFLNNNFKDDSFDFVFGINSLHHVFEKSKDISNFSGIENRMNIVFKEMKRIAKPNGKIVIWDTVFDSIYRFIKIRFMI